MPFWEIAKKDLLLLRRDLRALFILVAFPLLFITIIGLTTGKLLGWKSENQILKIGVVDRVDYATMTKDHRRIAGNIVRKIVNGLRSGKGRRTTPLAANFDYEAALDREEFDAVLVIGPDFYHSVRELDPQEAFSRKSGAFRGGFKSLNMELHSKLAKNSGTRSIIEELLFDQTAKTIAPYILCKFKTREVTGVTAAKVNRDLSRLFGCGELETEIIKLAPENIDEKADFEGSDNVYQVLIPSYTVMFVFFLVNIMARSFLQERDLGTLRRLRMAPISAAGLVAGKTIPFLVISLVQTGLLFVAGKLLFRMTWGPVPWMIIPVIFATSLSAVGLGLVVATLVRSDSQVSAYANIIVISMAGISGCFMPRKWLPDPMLKISLATPHAWALMSYEQLLIKDTPDLWLVWQYCGVMVLFAAAFLAFGCWRFRSYD